jgi:leucyl aminopeptidase
VEGGLLGLYSFTRYKQERDDKTVKELTILASPSRELEAGLSWTSTVASAVSFCRDLVNTPANDMTPTHLAAVAFALKKRNLSVEVLEEKDVRRLGMGAYLSVAKGSDEPLKFIVLDYRGAKKPPVVLIGKAVTFDSGGISLKPSDGMEKMKYDMAGGAAVLGVIKAAAEAGLPLRVVGIVPATENLPGGSASRPGDVVKTIGGKTVEIISTDAEGRMALADAIGYARRFHPAAVIDIATLTGACSIALGNEAVAMMGNDKALMDRLRDSGTNTHERVWEMPLFDEYEDYLKSDIADLKNTGGRSGSLVSSGYFLKEFAEDMSWAHLDIAGTAWVEKDKPHMPKGASGVGVRLLLDVLKGME